MSLRFLRRSTVVTNSTCRFSRLASHDSPELTVPRRALPYFVNRWVLRNKDAHLEELYDFAEVDATSYLAAPAEKGADQA